MEWLGFDHFLGMLKNGKRKVFLRFYFTQIYDIIENKFSCINQPDILIVEGIQTYFQLPPNEQIYIIVDFFDFLSMF